MSRYSSRSVNEEIWNKISISTHCFPHHMHTHTQYKDIISRLSKLAHHLSSEEVKDFLDQFRRRLPDSCDSAAAECKR